MSQATDASSTERGRGAGKAVFDDLLVVARSSKASPLLYSPPRAAST